jgi:hypothetical protein
MGFLNHSEGGMVIYQVFLLSPLQKSQGKAIELTVNSKEEKSKDFCLDFVQEFGLRMRSSRVVRAYSY